MGSLSCIVTAMYFISYHIVIICCVVECVELLLLSLLFLENSQNCRTLALTLTLNLHILDIFTKASIFLLLFMYLNHCITINTFHYGYKCHRAVQYN